MLAVKHHVPGMLASPFSCILGTIFSTPRRAIGMLCCWRSASATRPTMDTLAGQKLSPSGSIDSSRIATLRIFGAPRGILDLTSLVAHILNIRQHVPLSQPPLHVWLSLDRASACSLSLWRVCSRRERRAPSEQLEDPARQTHPVSRCLHLFFWRRWRWAR